MLTDHEAFRIPNSRLGLFDGVVQQATTGNLKSLGTQCLCFTQCAFARHVEFGARRVSGLENLHQIDTRMGDFPLGFTDERL